MPNGKTIRQIADEIGVTRQAVYQKIKSNQSTISNLKLYTFIVDSVKYYTPDGEALIKSLFSGKSTVKQTVNEGVKLSTESVYTPVKKFTPCKDGETPIKPEVSDGAVNDGVNKSVNVSTNPVYTSVNEFTPCKDGETPIKSGVSDGAVNDGVNKSVNMSTEPVYTPVNEFTANLTDLFTAQLKEKDKQIAEKDKQLAEKDAQIAALTAMLQSAQEQQAALVQTLAAEQALAAADKRQLLLQAGKQNEQLENTQKQETAKKSFFSRIFRK